jgi:hypothetical protein
LAAPSFQPYSLHLQVQKSRLLFNPLEKEKVVRACRTVVVDFSLVPCSLPKKISSFPHTIREASGLHVIVTLVVTSHLESDEHEQLKTNPVQSN